MKQQEIISRVKKRMDAEDLTQRLLAKHLGVSQGHLSKLLRGKLQRRSRVLRALEAWLTESDTPVSHDSDADEKALLTAARRVAKGSSREAMHLMTDLMRLLERLRRLSRRRK